MNIGSAARASGISAKMIRYYESLKLIPAVGRTASGYRDYDARDVERLKFIRRARGLGFSSLQLRSLLQLWQDRDRASSDVKRIALDHVDRLREQARELEKMAASLAELADDCRGDDAPACPILDNLAVGDESAPQTERHNHLFT